MTVPFFGEIMKELKGNISVLRSCSGGVNHITIRLEDYEAGIRFADIEMSYEGFAKALTGLSCVPISYKLRHTENLGKTEERKDLVFELPEEIGFGSRVQYSEEMSHKYADEGWTASTYFGRKTSFFEKDNKQYAKTTQSRYVETTDGK